MPVCGMIIILKPLRYTTSSLLATRNAFYSKNTRLRCFGRVVVSFYRGALAPHTRLLYCCVILNIMSERAVECFDARTAGEEDETRKERARDRFVAASPSQSYAIRLIAPNNEQPTEHDHPRHPHRSPS